MSMAEPLHFDSHEWDEMKRWAGLEPGQRIGAMIQAREFAVGLIRGQLTREHPELSEREVNLLVLAELERRNGRAG